MRTGQEGIALIKKWEGFVPHKYICAAGYPTIGYGHVILPHETFPDRISMAEAEALLAKDLLQFERSVTRLITVPLTQGQFDALVSFTFNLGGGALQRSTLRQKLNRREYENASREFIKWVWAGGRKLNGLVKRREAEKDLFLS